MDTYHEVSGTDVKPQVHPDYDGGDIVLPGDPSVVIRAADEPALAACTGMTIITADGTTLLGADDKAGVAEILEALWRFHDDPARAHGPIRVAFTPDEEAARGTEHFDVKRFAAAYAYTVDGSGVGELESETFCADTAFLTVTGADVHPGYAKGKMINALRVVSDIVMALPQHRTPETTEGREGYLHPISLSGNVSEARAQFLVRDFTEDGLSELEGTLRGGGGVGRAQVPGREGAGRGEAVVSQHEGTCWTSTSTSPTMRRRPSAARASRRSARRSEAVPTALRLSFMGVPTPNLFDGSMNFHGKREYVPLEWMDAAVETILHLMDVWVEKSRG